MKLVLLGFIILVSLIKQWNGKKYTTIAFSIIGILLPIIGLVLDNLGINFKTYEFFPWVTFWLIQLIYSFKNEEVEKLGFLLPITSLLVILNFNLGTLSFVILETIFLLNVLYNDKAFYKTFKMESYIKLFAFYSIFSINTFNTELSLNILFGCFVILNCLNLIKNTARCKSFDYFYSIVIFSFSTEYLPEKLNYIAYIYFGTIALLCLALMLNILKRLNLVPYFKIRINIVERIHSYLKIKMNQKAVLNYPGYYLIKKNKKIVDTQRSISFSNDIVSSLLISFLIIMILTFYYLYRFN